MVCKQCGGTEFDYRGMDDGGGPYGDSIVEEWKCFVCGYVVEKTLTLEDVDDDEAEDLWDSRRDSLLPRP